MNLIVGMKVRIKLSSNSYLRGYCGWVEEIDEDPTEDKPILVYVNDLPDLFSESELEQIQLC